MPRRFAIQRLVVPIVATLAAASFVGCPGELEDPERFGPATCSAPIDVPTEIFVPSCADVLCHGSVEPAAGLDLLSDNVLARLIDAPSDQCTDWLRIDSANPDESLLLHKLEEPFPDCGDRMPLGGRLSREQIACVRDWVLTAVGKGDGGMTDADTSDAQDGASDGAASAEASD